MRIGTEPGRVKRIRLNGLTDVWTERGMRTVDSSLIRPPKRGDSLLTGQPPTERKRGTR